MTVEEAFTAVTYHYVRPVAGSMHPRLSALELAAFVRQIEDLARWVDFVDVEQVARWVHERVPLPARAVLLTFDDGYADHFRHVRPALLERGIPAVFFLPGAAVVERVPLDANLVQFLLASVASVDELVLEIEDALRADGMGAAAIEALRDAECRPAFFDEASVVYVKRLLQYAAPEPLRSQLLDDLFRRHVSSDPAGFADELYLSCEQAEQLVDDGFHLGGHGWSHRRLSRLPAPTVDDELARSLALIERLDPDGGRLSFCYPYGDHSDAVVDQLGRQGVATAFTVETGAVRTGDDALRMPRVDTNDVGSLLRPPGVAPAPPR